MIHLLGLRDASSGGCCDPNTLFGQACCLAEGKDTSSYTQCSSQADNDPQYTAIDAQLQSISSWAPTGYFNPSDIQAVVGQQQALVQQALGVLQSVGAACGTAPGCQSGSLISQMQANLTANPNDGTNVMTRAGNYLAAASQAQSGISAALSPNYVYAPGFKMWVQDSLLAIEQAVHAALVIECQMPGWASVLGGVVSGFQAFVSFVSGIAGVAANLAQGAVAAGKTVVTAVETTSGILGWILNNLALVLGIAAVGTAGFYGYRYYRRRRLSPAMAGLGQKRGDRVQVPVRTDTWMMGDRYGEVTKVTKAGIAHVKLDKSGRTKKFNARDLEVI